MIFPRAKGLPLAAQKTLGCAVYHADVMMSPPPSVPFPPDNQVRRSAVAMETSPKEHDIIYTCCNDGGGAPSQQSRMWAGKQSKLTWVR